MSTDHCPNCGSLLYLGSKRCFLCETPIVAGGRRAGKTAARVQALRDDPRLSMVAKDTPEVRALAEREKLHVITLERDGNPTGDVMLRHKPD